MIARIENATYAEVVKALGGEHVVDNLASAPILSLYNIERMDRLRYSLPASNVTTYTYKPLVGLVSVTDPLGVTTGYEYDGLGRLMKTYIINKGRKELIERYEYNYANQQKTK